MGSMQPGRADSSGRRRPERAVAPDWSNRVGSARRTRGRDEVTAAHAHRDDRVRRHRRARTRPAGRSGAESHDLDVTVYDIAPERNEAARQRGFATVVDSLPELLDRVDMVDICTPSDTHADLVREVAAAGKHVLCEKPLGDDAGRGRRGGAGVCRGRRARCTSATSSGSSAQYRTAHDALVAGRLGQPAVLRFRRAGGLPTHNDWMTTEARSGGVVMDLMIHDIDQARWFAGDVVRAYGLATGKAETGDVATQAFAVLTHESGAITHLTASWAMKSGLRHVVRDRRHRGHGRPTTPTTTRRCGPTGPNCSTGPGCSR